MTAPDRAREICLAAIRKIDYAVTDAENTATVSDLIAHLWRIEAIVREAVEKIESLDA